MFVFVIVDVERETLHHQDNVKMVYPTDLSLHENLVRHEATHVDTLVDVLSMTNHIDDCRLVQVLKKLEVVQMTIAKVRMLNVEEDNLAEVDESSLLRTDAASARLAPTLASLSTEAREFTCFLANIPQASASSDAFGPYKFSNMSEQITRIYEGELRKATDRWGGVFATVCSNLQAVIPAEWKEKALQEEHSTYVNSKLLVQSLITGLGSDYLHGTAWLASLETIPLVFAAFKAGCEDFDKFKTVLSDTRDLIAVILGYNTITNKFPKASQAERRQFAKDLKKKLRSKFGKDYEMPQAMSDRIAAKINAK